jgi:alpha-D-xyloside xylohydrolase
VAAFNEIDGGLEWHGRHEYRSPDSVHQVVRVEPWGEDSVRVRAGLTGVRGDVPGALLEPVATPARIEPTDGGFRLVNGRLAAEISAGGLVTFSRADSGVELVAEEPAHFWWPGPRLFSATGNGYHRVEQRFRAYAGERVFGLGQHQHGLLDQKGAVIDLVQRNAEVSIPFLFSSRGYGLLWNSPAVGRVEFAANGTRWVAESARQIDYWVTTGDGPAAIMHSYADATGHAPMLPEWAAGFWQSKLRYRTQDELMAVAREHVRRGLPLAVIVSDFFHWTHLGDWRFDPAEWPDPAAMVSELAEMGVRLMVSVWPSVSPLSENYREMLDRGFLLATEQGPPVHADWPDKGIDVDVGVSFYDPTNPEARRFVWEQVREHYHSLGIRVWWLDACEPEIKPGTPANLLYRAGPGLEVGNLYPRENARAFHEGMAAAGETEILSLCRSAWAGSQRYGAALWSGDIASTFAALGAQVRAGLNVALSGIPWWTTDIGGFHGGDPESPEFRELIVRWFQYGVFCPLFRLHGVREPATPFSTQMNGGPNEVWSFGEEAYAAIRDILFLRERLRPYVLAQMRAAHECGQPPMRPLFYDFPHDERAWSVDDEFLFGPDILVAPVTVYGAREREVYLPAGADWLDPWTGTTHEGGHARCLPAPLDRVPVLLRDGANIPIRG